MPSPSQGVAAPEMGEVVDASKSSNVESAETLPVTKLELEDTRSVKVIVCEQASIVFHRIFSIAIHCWGV